MHNKTESIKRRLAVFIVICVGILGTIAYPSLAVSCVDSNVPFTSSTEEDATITSSKSYTKVIGVAGAHRVCKDGHGTITSESTNPVPINEVKVVGTYVEPPIVYSAHEPVYTSYGSTCRDGWHSSSVGRGSCSWHGGIAY